MKKTYAFHEPSDESLSRITELREKFSEIHDLIQRAAPESRERSVALTNLETAAMWAVKAVVFNDPRSKAHT